MHYSSLRAFFSDPGYVKNQISIDSEQKVLCPYDQEESDKKGKWMKYTVRMKNNSEKMD